jgi:hypothetical protein
MDSQAAPKQPASCIGPSAQKEAGLRMTGISRNVALGCIQGKMLQDTKSAARRLRFKRNFSLYIYYLKLAGVNRR